MEKKYILENSLINENENENENKSNTINKEFIKLPDLNSLCCYICTDFYTMKKRPLILVCGHTFCECCLTQLFDKYKEIQCSFCKVITKLEKFDDMIINYSMLNLCELITERNKGNKNLNFNYSCSNENNDNDNENASVLIPLCKSKEKFGMAIARNFNNGQNKFICDCGNFENYNEIDKLLECQECEYITCKDCFFKHKNHKLTNIVDFIESKTEELEKTCQSYKDLSAKMAALFKKLDKGELDKLIKSEKEKVNNFAKDAKSLIDKNVEIINNSLDKLYNDYISSLNEFKKEVKIFNTDSLRNYNIIKEFSNFHNIDNKERQKILKVYNFNIFCNEIKTFNNSVQKKMDTLITSEIFYEDFLRKIKNISFYKNKILKVGKLANDKITKQKNKDNKVSFFKRLRNK
jgi:hypothetical protein